MNDKIFKKDRLKLTIYYIFIMSFILFIFSSVLIYTIESKINIGFSDIVTISEAVDSPVQSVIDEIEFVIYGIDIILLIIIFFTSYYLSGKTLAPIQNMMVKQKRFAEDASHDLRTPLAIMHTSSEVLLKNQNSNLEEYIETTNSNLEEIKKMKKMIDDLFFVARENNFSADNNFTKIKIESFVNKTVHKAPLPLN